MAREPKQLPRKGRMPAGKPVVMQREVMRALTEGRDLLLDLGGRRFDIPGDVRALLLRLAQRLGTLIVRLERRWPRRPRVIRKRRGRSA